MSKSPGHRQWPGHKVREIPLKDHMRVSIGGETIAESDRVIRVDEDDHPARYYFPREDVRMQKLTPTDTTTRCPFKGEAHYFSIRADGRELEDSVWTYEHPYDEHQDLEGRLAFYDGQEVPGIRIRPRA